MISVIIPLYNKENSVKKTLNTVLSQSFGDFEVIIVNDGSTDSSLDRVEEVCDPRIRIIHQKNQGVSVARNRGIKEAKYDHIAFLDADDLWDMDYLETMMDLITNYQNCSVFAVGHKIIDHMGRCHNIILSGLSKNFYKGEVENYFEIVNKSDSFLWTSAVVVRKEALENIGGFPEGVRAGEDLLTWTKLALKYRIAYTRAIKAYFVHLVDKEKVFYREPDSKDVVFLELKKLLEEGGHSGLKEFIAKWCKNRLQIYLKMKKIELAKREFEKMRPYSKKGLKLFIYWILVHFSFCIGLAYRMNKGRRAIIKMFN